MAEHVGLALADRREMSEEQWLLARKAGIGASDIAAILGLSKYASPLTVWMDKTSPEVDHESSLAAELGQELEPFIRRKFTKWMKTEEGLDITVEEMPYILQHPEHPFILANLDGAFWHPARELWCDLECKTAGEYVKADWDNGEMPDGYYAQVQQQLAVTGWELAYVPVLIGNRQFEVRVVPRNQDVINGLIAAAQTFWNDFVIPKVAPAPIGLAADTDALKLLYPSGGKDPINLEHMADTYDELKALARVKKETEARQEQLKQLFMSEMGDAEVAVIGKGRVTWKMIERKAYSVEASSSRQFRVY